MKQRLRDLEARELWIAARVDELMDDDEWIAKMKDELFYCESDVICSLIKAEAEEKAAREHAAIMADLDDERISLAHGGQYE